MNKFYLKNILCLLLVFSINKPLQCQVLNDTSSLILVKQGVEYIYNYQFDKANDIYGILNEKFPGHPLPSLFHGMITYWQYFPLIPESPAVAAFRNDMLDCIDLCEEKRLLPGMPEYLLADIGARGLLLLYYADNGLPWEVIPMASKTYQDVVRSRDYSGMYADFYFVTGLYKYYREKYPTVHPVFKPFTMFFPRGNIEEGLAELKIAAEHAIFLKAEANTFLSGIFIGFENNSQEAYAYSKSLYEQFPGNNEFLANYARNLLLLKKYDEAERILSLNKNPESLYFSMEKNILRAVIYEKKYHDPVQAEELYKAGMNVAGEMGDFADDFHSYACFGLSRIMEAKGDVKLGKYYRKRAKDLATYKQINFDD